LGDIARPVMGCHLTKEKRGFIIRIERWMTWQAISGWLWVWAHLHLLVMRAPPLFATDFKSFFCRASDPPAVKKLKIEMLTAVADSGNTVGRCSLTVPKPVLKAPTVSAISA